MIYFLDEFLPIIIFIVFTIICIVAQKKKLKGVNRANNIKRNVNPVSFNRVENPKYVRRDLKPKTELSFMEDRNNDWLARQLREEARSLRRDNILDLGARHEVSCDADEVKYKRNR